MTDSDDVYIFTLRNCSAKTKQKRTTRQVPTYLLTCPVAYPSNSDNSACVDLVALTIVVLVASTFPLSKSCRHGLSKNDDSRLPPWHFEHGLETDSMNATAPSRVNGAPYWDPAGCHVVKPSSPVYASFHRTHSHRSPESLHPGLQSALHLHYFT